MCKTVCVRAMVGVCVFMASILVANLIGCVRLDCKQHYQPIQTFHLYSSQLLPTYIRIVKIMLFGYSLSWWCNSISSVLGLFFFPLVYSCYNRTFIPIEHYLVANSVTSSKCIV